MNRKSCRRRPEFDSLETMTLLSGISAMAHPAALPIIGPRDAVAAAITFNGTVKGTYKSHGLGVPDSFAAKGSLSPVGKISLTGSAVFSPVNPTGSMTITSTKNKHNKIFATLTTDGLQGPVFYTITGGTGTFAGASGGGQAEFAFTIAPHKGSGASHGKLTIMFINVIL